MSRKQLFLDFIKARDDFSATIYAAKKIGVDLNEFSEPVYAAISTVLKLGYNEQQCGWIEWWFYDAPKGKKFAKINGKKINLTKIEDFYDFMIGIE